MGFTTKAWHNAPDTTSPLSAAALIDLEQRLSSYTDLLVPIGIILPWGGDSAPNANWMLAQGQAISRTGYAALFALYGIRFGSGDGSLTFNLPNGKKRVFIGSDVSYAAGASGGEENHVLLATESGTNGNGTTAPSTTQGESGHVHPMSGQFYGNSSGGSWVHAVTLAAGSDWPVNWNNALSTGGSSGHTHVTNGAALNARNADIGHNTMQPYFVGNHVVRVL